MSQNRLISAGLEPVLSLTEKSCIQEYFNENHKNKPFLVAW